MKKKSGLGTLLSLAGRYKYKLILSCISAFISSILALVPFYFVLKIIDMLTKNNIDYNLIKTYAWLSLGVIIVRFLFFAGSGVLSHIAAFDLLYNLRIEITKHLGKVPLGYFGKNASGKIRKITHDDVEKIEMFIAHHIPDLCQAIVTPFAILIFLASINIKLTLVFLIPFILSLFAQMAMFKGYSHNMREYYDNLYNMNNTIVEYINGMPIIKAFNLTTDSFMKYKESVLKYKEIWIKFTKRGIFPYVCYFVLLDSVLLFLLPFGANEYFAGGISVSELLIFFLVGLGVLNNLKVIMTFGSLISQIVEGVSRIDQILAVEKKREGDKIFPSFETIKIKNLDFSYENGLDVLKNINLEIKKGEKVAFVGPSGAGKSTLGAILAGFYNLDKGQVFYDNVSIEEIKTEEVMENISYVFQDISILNDTVFENINMDRGMSRVEVEEIAKLACCHEFIMDLPNTYDTVMGEKGLYVSGGEKQRLSIARSMAKNSQILILDEATAYADAENEYEIQKAISHLAREKTVIIIAHRLSTIINADKIVVLDKGEVVEIGKHEELLNLDGLYKNMWTNYVESFDWSIKGQVEVENDLHNAEFEKMRGEYNA